MRREQKKKPNVMQNNTISPAQQSFINDFVALNISVKDFAVVMNQKYDFYYNNKDGYSWQDVELFDNILKQRNTPIRNYVDELYKITLNPITSDRECAAFIAAMHYYIYESPKQETTPAPVAVPDSLLEEYTKAGCTFGRVKDTKYIQVVRVASSFNNGVIVFLYKGSRKGAFEEVKKQFAGFIGEAVNGQVLTLWYENGEEIKDTIVVRTQQLDAAALKAAAIDWRVRCTCFADMPLALPAPKAETVTDSDILATAARIRANYEEMKQQAAADTVSKEATPAPIKNPNMLQDWGEKIGGARKDEATSHNSGATSDPAPIKKLKYGVIGYKTGDGFMTWYPKTSKRRYSAAYYIKYGEPVSLFSAEYLIMREEAERLLVEKYPNINNIFNFDIYHSYSKGYVITAKRVNIDVATFATLDEAREYMQSDKPAADLAALKAARTPEQVKRAAALVVRNSINRPRLGTNYVQGGNITPERLATTFGLRAVEFGNWMTADDRQTSINECYNSFCVLAELLEIDRYKIGNGTLAVAFGARGTGKANAHYELVKHVINLTRTRGAGSLAHEWAHAIDSCGEIKHNLSRGFYFGGYSYRCKQQGSYWGAEHEQFARAFETAIHYMLKDSEVIDDYLVNIIEDCKVYPTATENERIAPYVIEKIKTALQ